ncbi:flocculation protein FLO11-like [Stegastes partitus]|uniref:Flocculation protein FLO11-like n=1 Tax=Stegastes partitus TaxID=144197 RepID=A0A9Y4NRI6_9TELE|nr:PREDICTED: flocculation protein FLO11-like [Stegastes partitus]
MPIFVCVEATEESPIMANETTAQASYIQENPEADENICPGVTSAAGASKLKVQVEDVTGCSSTQPHEEKKTLSDSFTFATPAPTSSNGGGKAKSRLSTLQSALTPVLKCLNIGNKCPPRRSAGGSETPVYWLADEYLPEMTLLDDTCDSTMHLTRNDSALPDSAPATPVTARLPTLQPPRFGFSTNLKLNSENNNSEVQPPKLSKHIMTTAGTENNAKTADPSESKCAPESLLFDKYFPEITLLDVTHDSELGEQISPMDVKQDIPELSGHIVAEPSGSDTIQSEDRSVGENMVKSTLETTQDVTMGSVLENNRSSSELSGQSMVKLQTSAEDTLGSQPANITRDISSTSGMSAPCPQVSTSDIECNISSKTVTSELHVEPVESSDTVEANNEDLHSSHDTKLTSKVVQLNSTTDVSVNGTFDVQPSDLSASTSLNTTTPMSCPQNNTIDLPPSNACSPKVGIETTDQTTSVTTETSLVTDQNGSAVKQSGPCDEQNTTFDRHSLQKSSGSTIIVEAAAATTFHAQNNTFDCKPPSKQNGTITLSETSSSDSHQSTMEKPPSPKVCNLTTSLKDSNSEVHPNEASQDNGTAAPTDENGEMAGSPETTCEANAVVEDAPGAGRCEPKAHSPSNLPVTEGLSDTLNQRSTDSENNNNTNTFNLDDTLDLRADCLVTSTPMTKNFNFATLPEESKTIGAQKKLYGDGPSQPADQALSDIPPNLVCDRKTFFRPPIVKTLCPPSKATSQLLRPKPGSALPGHVEPRMSCLPMKRQRTQVDTLKNAAASDAPQGTTGISSSYNLRPLTTGSKLPSSGLRRPQLSSIPSGIQRATPGLRPPSAKSNTQASSSTDKLCGPTAANPVTKTLQAKKHPLTRGEALPLSKRKKMDVPSSGAEASTSACNINKAKTLKQPAASQRAKTQRDDAAVSTSTAEAPVSCDATSKARSLKPPAASQRAVPAKTQRDDAVVPASSAAASTACDAASRARVQKPPVSSHRALLAKPQGHACAKCGELEEQLKEKSEEIRRLKEELQKYSKQEEEC